MHDLVEGKNKWVQAVPNQTYSYIYRQRCFCPNDNDEIVVNVKNGKITSTTLRSNGKKEIRIQSLPTIKQLFEFILENLKRQEWENNLSIEAQYDEKLGFPTVIKIRRPVMDGNQSIFITNVVLQ